MRHDVCIRAGIFLLTYRSNLSLQGVSVNSWNIEEKTLRSSSRSELLEVIASRSVHTPAHGELLSSLSVDESSQISTNSVYQYIQCLYNFFFWTEPE